MKQVDDDVQDYVLAGGGLQNCLVALFLLHKNPKTRVTLVERGPALGGNHTWSFHATDVPESAGAVLSPVLSYAWDRYDVLFPGYRRTVKTAYHTITSIRMHAVLTQQFAGAPNGRLLLNTEIATVEADRVVLASGDILRGRHVIDARGLVGEALEGQAGFQKFVGLEVQLAQPGPYFHPVLMDAEVPQIDGYRFFYVLPLTRERLLIEDTRFSDSPNLNVSEVRNAVLQYADEKGLRLHEILRMESGVLPMPYAMRRSWPTAMPLAGGYAGGFMHPATGYSFPVALRLAQYIAKRSPDSPFDGDWPDFVQRLQHQYRFATFLNRLLFTAYPPEKRSHIFERFYHLPESAIERFYRMELTPRDRAQLFLGRPPRGFSAQRLIEGALSS